MFDRLASQIARLFAPEPHDRSMEATDHRLATAALLVHAIAIDGRIEAEDRLRLPDPASEFEFRLHAGLAPKARRTRSGFPPRASGAQNDMRSAKHSMSIWKRLVQLSKPAAPLHPLGQLQHRRDGQR